MNAPIPAYLAREAQEQGDASTSLETSNVAELPRAAAPRPAAAVQDEDVATLVRSFDIEKTAVIPAGMRIKGDVSTEGVLDIVVFGTVEGDIITDKGVYVMNGGTVKGHITSSGEVVVAGTVEAGEGTPVIETKDRFFLATGGQVNGDVVYQSLRVHEGGVVRGRMMPGQK